MSADLDYLDHLARESDRFADVLLAADPMRPVPSCPDWTTVDLFWHLTEVQWFWGSVVREQVSDPGQLTAARPQRPSDLGSLGHLYATVSASLEDSLRSADPQTPVWTWSEDQTVGFVRRRQAHEALIHRIDAELATGTETDVDPALAADGVDEVLRVMHGAGEGDERVRRENGVVRIETTDTGTTWTVALARRTGTDPGSADPSGEPSLIVLDRPSAGEEPDATVRGPAADLDCWLWGRLAADRVERAGDADVLSRLQAVVDLGVG